jgi:hypothetical protein
MTSSAEETEKGAMPQSTQEHDARAVPALFAGYWMMMG